MSSLLRIITYVFLIIGFTGTGLTTAIASCGSNSLGVSRTMRVNTQGGLRVGLVQYADTLALRDHEVVLTFDDGPIGRATQRILDTLAAECTRATFFVVGSMARAHPEQLRAMYRAGHTIAAHSNRHPMNMNRMSQARAQREINAGFESINITLGTLGQAAPFFRYPGLAHSTAMNNWLATQNIGIFSADIMGDDWRRISSNEILRRTMRRLNQRGRGIILLHDIHNKTASMLPALLRQLKDEGYRVVHIVPTNGRFRLANEASQIPSDQEFSR
ncbi:MAG: polysaccharide deacetylase family protein [Rhizobiales bacterium]|nr:polysaccharide deacetylase family protein [Hyphomicrobiales bacterium]